MKIGIVVPYSWSFGGGVANPVNALAKMIASLHDADGKVTVPGFYDKVIALTEIERKEIAGLPFDEKEWLASTGSPSTVGEKGYDGFALALVTEPPADD